MIIVVVITAIILDGLWGINVQMESFKGETLVYAAVWKGFSAFVFLLLVFIFLLFFLVIVTHVGSVCFGSARVIFFLFYFCLLLLRDVGLCLFQFWWSVWLCPANYSERESMVILLAMEDVPLSLSHACGRWLLVHTMILGPRSYCVRTQREYSNYTAPHPGSACCPSFFLGHLPPMISLLKHTALRELLRSQMFWQIPPLPVDWNCKIIFLLKSLNLTVIDQRFDNGVDILHPVGLIEVTLEEPWHSRMLPPSPQHLSPTAGKTSRSSYRYVFRISTYGDHSKPATLLSIKHNTRYGHGAEPTNQSASISGCSVLSLHPPHHNSVMQYNRTPMGETEVPLVRPAVVQFSIWLDISYRWMWTLNPQGGYQIMRTLLKL